MAKFFQPPATYTRAVAPRTAEERQGLKQLASELRELLSLLEQEKVKSAAKYSRESNLTFVLWQDTKSGRRDVAQPGSAHAWGA
jgi:hypothetical protein